MLKSIRKVREIAPQARLDCCPYDQGDNGTGFFVRNGPMGHWLSKVRKSPLRAWDNAAERLQAATADEDDSHSNQPPLFGKRAS
jgi:hypothetical protein